MGVVIEMCVKYPGGLERGGLTYIYMCIYMYTYIHTNISQIYMYIHARLYIYLYRDIYLYIYTCV